MSSKDSILFRPPKLKDGMDVHRLIGNSPPLDVNSSYCNLLQCSHFASTSVAAEREGSVVGFISGYTKPENPDTLFVWQVAVSEQARGMGLASRMLVHLLARPQCENTRYLETTITADNEPSWALFKRFARNMEADFHSSEWLDQTTHFAGQHDSELLVRIGPFNSRN